MITKGQILEDFWDSFPQYKEMTPTYNSIIFEEEEIREWNHDWILKDLEGIIKIN